METLTLRNSVSSVKQIGRDFLVVEETILWGLGRGDRGKRVYFAFTYALFSSLAGNSVKGFDPVVISCIGSHCISSICLMWVLFKTARTMIWRQISSDWCILEGQMQHTCAWHKQSTVGSRLGWGIKAGREGWASLLSLGEKRYCKQNAPCSNVSEFALH